MRIFIISIFILFVLGCSITPEEYNKAEELCKNNGEVSQIYLELETHHIYCKNGAKFLTNKI